MCEMAMKTLKKVLLALVGILLVPVLVLATFSRNDVVKARSDGGYDVVEDVTYTRTDEGKKCLCECSFTLQELTGHESLVFYINHHDVRVFVGGECVYTLTSRDDMFATSGGTWISVPLNTDDSGKEVRVLLTPTYDNYKEDNIEFLLGSEIAVHNATLHKSLPVMILSFCVIFSGILIICLALYHSIKGMSVDRLYALGIMAIAAGVWRITYDRMAYMLFENFSVLEYTLSIVSLMALALAMLNSLEMNERNAKFVRIASAVYCGLYSVQFVLQIFGIADLRETLKLVHGTLILSAAAFICDGIIQLVHIIKKKHNKLNFSWLLGMGVVADLILYYVETASFKLIFTLIAILCYTVLEGVSLLFTYVQQKTELEEMGTQLTLSRTTLMMSQIRSHFVFNILNAISGMCKYDPQLADDTIVRFSRYLRNNIDIMEKDGNIPFSVDLQQLEDYVTLEQVRFGDKVEFYSDIGFTDFMIPPLILQPIVENAIKHGIGKKQGNGTIVLSTQKVGNDVVVTVKDDGVGFDLSELEKESSVGIRNIRFRLEHLVHGTMDIQSEVGKGTTVTITLPQGEN